MKKITLLLAILFPLFIFSQAVEPVPNSQYIWGHSEAKTYVKAPLGIFEEISNGSVVIIIDTNNMDVSITGGGLRIEDPTADFTINGKSISGNEYNPAIYGASDAGEVDATPYFNNRCPGGDCSKVFHPGKGIYIIDGIVTFPRHSTLIIDAETMIVGVGTFTGDSTVIIAGDYNWMDTTITFNGTWIVPEWKSVWWKGGKLTGTQLNAVDSICKALTNVSPIKNYANIDFMGNLFRNGQPFSGGSGDFEYGDTTDNQTLQTQYKSILLADSTKFISAADLTALQAISTENLSKGELGYTQDSEIYYRWTGSGWAEFFTDLTEIERNDSTYVTTVDRTTGKFGYANFPTGGSDLWNTDANGISYGSEGNVGIGEGSSDTYILSVLGMTNNHAADGTKLVETGEDGTNYFVNQLDNHLQYTLNKTTGATNIISDSANVYTLSNTGKIIGLKSIVNGGSSGDNASFLVRESGGYSQFTIASAKVTGGVKISKITGSPFEISYDADTNRFKGGRYLFESLSKVTQSYVLGYDPGNGQIYYDDFPTGSGYLINNGDDVTSGILTAAGFTLAVDQNITFGTETLNYNSANFQFELTDQLQISGELIVQDDVEIQGSIKSGIAVVSDIELGILDGATLTTTEFNYVDGVTSSIQDQLNNRYVEYGLSDYVTDLATGTSVAYWDAPYTLTITNIKISALTAPTGSSVIVDVHKAGTTFFTTQGNRPTIAISGTQDNSSVPDVTSVTENDRITFDIDQIGSTITGTGLSIKIYYTID